jgi:hypothetical protein
VHGDWPVAERRALPWWQGAVKRRRPGPPRLIGQLELTVAIPDPRILSFARILARYCHFLLLTDMGSYAGLGGLKCSLIGILEQIPVISTHV